LTVRQADTKQEKILSTELEPITYGHKFDSTNTVGSRPLFSQSRRPGAGRILEQLSSKWYVRLRNTGCYQCCGSGSGLDPDSNRRLDPDPDSESGSGSSKGILAVLKPTKVIKFIKFNQMLARACTC
jgi:hypothetical protein